MSDTASSFLGGPRTQYLLRCMKTRPVQRARIMFRPDYLDARSPQIQSGDGLRYGRKFRAPEKAPFVRGDNDLPSAYYGPHVDSRKSRRGPSVRIDFSI